MRFDLRIKSDLYDIDIFSKKTNEVNIIIEL